MMDLNAPIMSSPFVRRFGQVPLTRFCPLERYLNVKVLGITLPKHLTSFVGACHRESPGEVRNVEPLEVLEFLGKGKTLWQCLEVINVMLQIRCSRVLTHQIVRTRIGATFSQQCTGDIDSRHADVVVPNALYNSENSDGLENYIMHCLMAKLTYAKMVDRVSDYCLQEARYILPAGLGTFIYCNFSLGALADFVHKRDEVATQTWEMLQLANRIRDGVIEAAPWTRPLLEARPQKTKLWYQTKDCPFQHTNLFRPEPEMDDFKWNPKSFVHGLQSHRDISSGPSGQVKFYYGTGELDIHYWENAANSVDFSFERI